MSPVPPEGTSTTATTGTLANGAAGNSCLPNNSTTNLNNPQTPAPVINGKAPSPPMKLVLVKESSGNSYKIVSSISNDSKQIKRAIKTSPKNLNHYDESTNNITFNALREAVTKELMAKQIANPLASFQGAAANSSSASATGTTSSQMNSTSNYTQNSNVSNNYPAANNNSIGQTWPTWLTSATQTTVAAHQSVPSLSTAASTSNSSTSADPNTKAKNPRKNKAPKPPASLPSLQLSGQIPQNTFPNLPYPAAPYSQPVPPPTATSTTAATASISNGFRSFLPSPISNWLPNYNVAPSNSLSVMAPQPQIAPQINTAFTSTVSTMSTMPNNLPPPNLPTVSTQVPVQQKPGKPKKIKKISAAAAKRAAAAASNLQQLQQLQQQMASAVANLNPTQQNAYMSPPLVVGTNSTVSTSSATSQSSSGTIAPVPILAAPATPCNFKAHLEDATISLVNYKKYPVAANSLEYETIVNLLNPLKVLSCEQIVNSELWNRFVSTRKEMLRAKSDDLKLLIKLGLDEKELMRAAHFTMNFQKDPALVNQPFSDNFCLLFHCTRNQANLDKILLQGLDERLANQGGGLLGKGIYFSDSPMKAMGYDGGAGIMLIFGVLLGDCLSVDSIANKHTFVREPEKSANQKRNIYDLNFDSIVAQPGGPNNNEYVIYNRYQCCPLYLVKFDRNAKTHKTTQYGEYHIARSNLPPIAWSNTSGGWSMPNNSANVAAWPFFAYRIFVEKMKALQEKEEEGPPQTNKDAYKDEADDIAKAVANSLAEEGSLLAGATSSVLSVTNQVTKEDEEAIMLDNLTTLAALGFIEEAKNRDILKMYQNNLDHAVNHLLDQNQTILQLHPTNPTYSTAVGPTTISTASTSTALTNDSSRYSGGQQQTNPIPIIIDISDDDDDKTVKKPFSTKTIQNSMDEGVPEDVIDWALNGFDVNYLTPKMETTQAAQIVKEDCMICCCEFECYTTAPHLWVILVCSHRLCAQCHAQIQTTRTTMSGLQHTFVKCPFCQGTSGFEIGTCPDGKITVDILHSSCVGYEQYNTISINYHVEGTHPLNRTAFLPNNVEGQKVLSLLRIAWDRRLCFTVGESVTTGRRDVLVWNIHHKTNQSGGVAQYGYPDPTYLDRVKWELKGYGIE